MTIPDARIEGILLPKDVVGPTMLLESFTSFKSLFKLRIHYTKRILWKQLKAVTLSAKMETAKFLGLSAQGLSRTCGTAMVNLIEESKINHLYLAFLYSFAYTAPTLETGSLIEVILPNGGIINVMASRGVFRYGQKEKKFLIYESPVSSSPIDLKKAFKGVLFGAKMLNNVIEEANVHQITYYVSKRDRLKNGTIGNVYIEGKLISISKDSSTTLEFIETISRQIKAISQSREFNIKNLLNCKRQCLKVEAANAPNWKKGQTK